MMDNLAEELRVTSAQVAKWLAIKKRGTGMSASTGEAFCRLVVIVDALLDLHDGDYVEVARWLTLPRITFSNARAVDLLKTEAGGKAVLQLVHAIEYGLPV